MQQIWRFLRMPEVAYSAGVIWNSALTLIAALIAARYSAAANFGAVQEVILIPTYAAILQLGIFNGENRNVAFYRGRGRLDKIANIIASAQFTANVLSGLGVAITVAYAAWSGVRGGPTVPFSHLSLLLIALICEPQSAHFDAALLSSRRFSDLNRAMALQNGVSTPLVMLPMWLGIDGFVLGRIVFYAIRYASRRRVLGTQFGGGAVSYAELAELVKTGFPLMLGGVLFSYVSIADRSVLAIFSDDRTLGLYTLTTILVTGAQMIPTCINYAVYPRVVERLGKSGDASALRPLLTRAIVACGVVLVVASAAAVWLVEPIITRLVPEYIDVIRPCIIAVGTMWVYAYLIPTGVIAAIGRNGPYLAANFLALLALWGGGVLIINFGWGLTHLIAWRLTVTFLLGAFTIAFAYYLCRSSVRPAPIVE